jgi:hypothetical protein
MVIISLTGPAIPLKAQESNRPIGRSIAHHAAQLAVVPPVAPSGMRTTQDRKSVVTDWFAVRMLKPGTEIIVMVRGAQPHKRTFRTATEFDVTVERPDGREDVVARGDVIEVRVLATRGSVGAAIVGAVLGAALGANIAAHLAYVRCQPSCGDEGAAMVLSAVGIPLAVGLGGYHLTKHSYEQVIYRAR